MCLELLARFVLAFARLKKEKINACYAGYFVENDVLLKGLVA